MSGHVGLGEDKVSLALHVLLRTVKNRQALHVNLE